MARLKADIHVHTSEDPEDYIRYSAKELIDMAYERGFKVISITNHNALTYSQYLRDYARERGIILIPGMEATIQGRHVLLYNVDPQKVRRDSIEHLRELRDKNTLIVAPHPYFPGLCALRDLFTSNLRLFDAIEISHFYAKNIDFNKKALETAQKARIPVVGTSDAHQRIQFGTTYSVVEADEDPNDIIAAIKAGRVDVATRPLRLMQMAKIGIRMAWRNTVVINLKKRRNGGPKP